MPWMRALPQSGMKRVASIDCSARWRKSFASIAMNHCDVARKMTGLWQRQQCGY